MNAAEPGWDKAIVFLRTVVGASVVLAIMFYRTLGDEKRQSPLETTSRSEQSFLKRAEATSPFVPVCFDEREEWQSFLNQNGHRYQNVVVGLSPDVSHWLIWSLRRSVKLPAVPVIAYGLSELIAESMSSDENLAVVSRQPFGVGYRAVQLLAIEARTTLSRPNAHYLGIPCRRYGFASRGALEQTISQTLSGNALPLMSTKIRPDALSEIEVSVPSSSVWWQLFRAGCVDAATQCSVKLRFLEPSLISERDRRMPSGSLLVHLSVDLPRRSGRVAATFDSPSSGLVLRTHHQRVAAQVDALIASRFEPNDRRELKVWCVHHASDSELMLSLNQNLSAARTDYRSALVLPTN
ncbi:MAG: hypothetical protein AAGD07_25175 [Planctomycetota bacterium]